MKSMQMAVRILQYGAVKNGSVRKIQEHVACVKWHVVINMLFFPLLFFVGIKVFELVALIESQHILTKLWNETDRNTDYEEAEAKIVIQEKMPDCIKMFFVHKHCKKDHAFVGGIVSGELKRLALLYEKSKEFARLLERMESVMGHSPVVDDVIRKGIGKLIAENPDKHCLKRYLRSVLI